MPPPSFISPPIKNPFERPANRPLNGFWRPVDSDCRRIQHQNFFTIDLVYPVRHQSVAIPDTRFYQSRTWTIQSEPLKERAIWRPDFYVDLEIRALHFFPAL